MKNNNRGFRWLFFVFAFAILFCCTQTAFTHFYKEIWNKNPRFVAMQKLYQAFKLNPSEHPKFGSVSKELYEFAHQAFAIKSISEGLAQKAKDGKIERSSGRVFHDKSHGCLTGRIDFLSEATRRDDPNNAGISDSLIELTEAGLFAKTASFPVLIRFSNGQGITTHDASPDVRGMGLKIFYSGMDPERAGQQTAFNVDFPMTNGPTAFGRDVQQFVGFAEANAKSDVDTLKYFVEQRILQILGQQFEIKSRKMADPREVDYLQNFISSTMKHVDSVATERYWSGHAYQLNPQRNMKLSLIPVGWKKQNPDENVLSIFKETLMDLKDLVSLRNLAATTFENLIGDHKKFDKLVHDRVQALKGAIDAKLNLDPNDKNYLRRELQERADKGPLQFRLVMQVESVVEPKHTPVENGLVEWSEKDALPVTVAYVTLDQQHFDTPERDAACNQMSFTPAHYYADNRPVGNFGRGRLFAYLSSQLVRGANPDNVDPALVNQWRAEENAQ